MSHIFRSFAVRDVTACCTSEKNHYCLFLHRYDGQTVWGRTFISCRPCWVCCLSFCFSGIVGPNSLLKPVFPFATVATDGDLRPYSTELQVFVLVGRCTIWCFGLKSSARRLAFSSCDFCSSLESVSTPATRVFRELFSSRSFSFSILTSWSWRLTRFTSSDGL